MDWKSVGCFVVLILRSRLSRVVMMGVRLDFMLASAKWKLDVDGDVRTKMGLNNK